MTPEPPVCPTCGGTGRLQPRRCSAIVVQTQRQCKHLAVELTDEQLASWHPGQTWLRDYCAYHGNRTLREQLRRVAGALT